MDGPRITLILLFILSDPIRGMSRGGRPGINRILITGRVLNKSIPIGAGTMLVSIMTRIFIIPTIVAKGEVGIRDSMASVLLGLPALAAILLAPLAQPCVNLEPLVLAAILLEALVKLLRVKDEDPVLVNSLHARDRDPALGNSLHVKDIDPVLVNSLHARGRDPFLVKSVHVKQQEPGLLG